MECATGQKYTDIQDEFYFTPSHLVLVSMDQGKILIKVQSREAKIIRNLVSFVSIRKKDKMPIVLGTGTCHPECYRKYTFAKYMKCVQRPKVPKCKHRPKKQKVRNGI